MPTIAASPELIEDLNESGSPVTSRIADAEQARAIVQRMLSDDRIRAARRVKVQGKIDGNAPVSARKLQEADREGDSNLNWREAKGHILNAWTPYFDLTIEVPVCVQGDLEFASSEQDADLMRGFAEYFHDMVFKWSGFDRVEQMRDWQMLVHGVGVMAWEDEFNWRPIPVLCDDFYLPDETDSDMENAEMAMITQERNAGQLWRNVENEKFAVASGWKPKDVQQAIMSLARNGTDAKMWKWDKWQHMLKNGDIYVSQKLTKRVNLATLLVKEMNGRISQHIIQYGTGVEKTEFLFSKIGRFADWNECAVTFPYDVGSDGSYHSVKGLGTEIFPYCELSDRIKNSTADMVLNSIQPMFQPKSGTTAEAFQTITMGGKKIIPPNIDYIKMDVSGSLQPALEVSREMQNTLMQNTGTYRQSVSQPSVERTAKEVTLNAMDQAKLSKGSHNRFYRCKDRQYAEMWRRATNPKLKDHHPGAKEALAFQAKCYKLCDKMGIEHKALQAVENIRAYRSMGLGSAAMRIEISQALLQNIDRFDEVGQNEILRMFVSAMTSFHSVDAIVPSLTTGRDNTNDDAVAAQEDNSFSILGPEAEAAVTPGQDHVIHLNHHVASMEKDAATCQQGQQDPRECFKRLEAKGAHSHEHLAKLQANPTRQAEFKAFSARLAPLASFQDQLQQHIDEANAANPKHPEGQPDPALVKVQHDAALKQQKQDVTLTLKEQKQHADLILKSQRQQADIVMDARKVAVDNSLKDASTAADVRRKNAASISSSNGN